MKKNNKKSKYTMYTDYIDTPIQVSMLGLSLYILVLIFAMIFVGLA